MSIKDLKRDWEDLAELDPYWSILSVQDRKFGNWDVDEFFITGQQDIDRILNQASKLGHPLKHESALDFGCGVGRLTRALAKKFKHCYGVDISENMIKKAIKLNSSFHNCKFITNDKEDLKIFQDNFFDLIYSNIVLQHMPTSNMIKLYISEFVRILNKKGLLIFQLPSNIPNLEKGLEGANKYGNLRKKGHSAEFLYKEKNLNPIRMNCVPEEQVVLLLEKCGAKILEIQQDSMAGPNVQSKTYFVTK